MVILGASNVYSDSKELTERLTMSHVIVLNGNPNRSAVVVVLPDSNDKGKPIVDKDLPDPYEFMESEPFPTTGSNFMDKLINLLP